jgi:DNA repair protein RadC
MKHIPLVSLRLVRERTVPYPGRSLQSAQAVYDLFRDLAGDLDREAVWIACLDAKNRLACLSQVSVGSLDASMVHPREVMKTVLMANASAMILVHNHPSGDPAPSAEDRAVTDRIRQTADLFGIRFLDHVIVGDGRFYSFNDEGGMGQ